MTFHHEEFCPLTFRTSFLEWALAQFPALAADFEGESARNRIHFAFLAFRDHTQRAIDKGDRDRLEQLFDMATQVLDCAYPEMRSLFHVVYVEDLKFHDTKRIDRLWAIEFLTPRLIAERAKSISGLPTAK